MRRRTWFRPLASLLALWLPLIAGEPGLLHPCPMHGAGRAVVASLFGGAQRIPAGHAAHGHHSGTAERQGTTPSHNHKDCTCIGGCVASADAAYLAPAEPVAIVASVERIVARTLPNAQSRARSAPDFARPFTTGPPRA